MFLLMLNFSSKLNCTTGGSHRHFLSFSSLFLNLICGKILDMEIPNKPLFLLEHQFMSFLTMLLCFISANFFLFIVVLNLLTQKITAGAPKKSHE